MEKGQWSSEKAWKWYNEQPWIRGYAGYPSNCVNRIAMWQEYGHGAVAEQIDYEFGLAKETGMNAVRAVIQFEVWLYEHDSFISNLDGYLSLADKHGLGVMLCIGNDCNVIKSRYKTPVFGEQHVDWGYHSGLRGGPHAHDTEEVGYQLNDEPDMRIKFYEMVDELAKRYGQDDRLQIWDVWNEIGNSRRKMLSVPMMERVFEILRENGVKQPLTADVWCYDENGAPRTEAQMRALELSDIITFHCYDDISTMVKIIENLKQYDRPIINNEWLNRYEGNDVEVMIPLFYLERIGSYCWGLIQGYSQTYEPWGIYFVDQQNGVKRDITRWQHDLYRFNGLPYIPDEIEVMKHFAELADKRYAEKHK